MSKVTGIFIFYMIAVFIYLVNLHLCLTVAALLTEIVFYFTKLTCHTELDLYNAGIKYENAVKTKGKFLENISYEVRTPMNEIIGMVEILNTLDIS